MTTELFAIIAWICIIATITTLSSLYARKQKRPDAIIALYVAIVIVSNILAYKIATFNLGFFTVFGPAATILFPITFLLTDVVTQAFGKEHAIRMIRTAFLCQLAVLAFIYLAIRLSPAPFWTDQTAFAQILGFTPRIAIASLIAFYTSETTDAHIFSYFKKLTKGRFLWMRVIVSGFPSMVLDTVIFVTIAFFGVAPLWPLIFGVIILKWLVGIINIPFMYLHRWILN